MSHASPESVQQDSKSRTHRWLWLLLIPVVIFGAALIISALGDAREPLASGPAMIPDAVTAEDLAPAIDPATGEVPTAAPTAETPAIEETMSPEEMMDPATGIIGGGLLQFSSEGSKAFWQSIITTVSADADGSLTVATVTGSPSMERSRMEGHSLELCQRFANQATDGQTGFTLLTKDGKEFATNLAENGSDLVQCRMP